MMNEKTKETEKKQRNHNMRYIIYVLALLVIIATLSFALYSNVFTGKNDIIIDTNDLKFNYNETTNSITIENATAMTDEEGIKNGGTFTFNVSATSQKAQTVNYAIYLTEESGNTLNSTNLRLTLQDNQNTTLVNPISYGSLKNFTPKTNSKLLYGKKLNLPTDNDKKDMYILKYWTASEQDEITKTTTEKKQTATLGGGSFKFKVNVMVNPLEKQVFMKSNPFEGFNNLQMGVKKIVLQDRLSPIENAVGSVDMSAAGDGSVMAYATVDDQLAFLSAANKIQNNETPTLEEIEAANGTIYIQGDGKIMAPKDSSGLFGGLLYARTIEGLENLDTSQVTNMYGMFTMIGSGYEIMKLNDNSFGIENYLMDLDLSSFDTSKVTNMSNMFAGAVIAFAGVSTTIRNLNLSNFDTSQVTNMKAMFFRSQYLKKLDFRKATFASVTEYYDPDDLESGGIFQNANNVNIITKDTTTKTWLQARLNESGVSRATITTVE